MNTLLPNTAAQTLRLTLYEGKQYFTEDFSHYLLIITREDGYNTGEDLAQVAVIVTDNSRLTTLTVTTVGLTKNGRYRYKVYGQNSAVNIDPENASVVGEVEIGWLEISDGSEYFDENTGTIPDDKRN